MPELPEVETTCRGIAPFVEKQIVRKVVIRQWQLRWPILENFSELVEGQIISAVFRRAKYILLQMQSGTVILHLGMSGSLRIVNSDQAPGKHDHVDFVFSRNCILRFNDPRKFGALLWTNLPIETHPLFIGLGPEPLSDAFDGNYLYRLSRKRSTAVKSFIMNASIVVGVGNIYASESLFMAGIHPARQAGRISLQRYERLVEAIKAVLQRSIAVGGTTLRDFVNEQGKPGYFQQALLVYGRAGKPCRQCQGFITQVKIAQRSSYLCPTCQS